MLVRPRVKLICMMSAGGHGKKTATKSTRTTTFLKPKLSFCSLCVKVYVYLFTCTYSCMFYIVVCRAATNNCFHYWCICPLFPRLINGCSVYKMVNIFDRFFQNPRWRPLMSCLSTTHKYSVYFHKEEERNKKLHTLQTHYITGIKKMLAFFLKNYSHW